MSARERGEWLKTVTADEILRARGWVEDAPGTSDWSHEALGHLHAPVENALCIALLMPRNAGGRKWW